MANGRLGQFGDNVPKSVVLVVIKFVEENATTHLLRMVDVHAWDKLTNRDIVTLINATVSKM